MSDDIKFYKNNPGIKSANQKIAFTEEQVQEYLKCANDPIYFIENYVKVISLDDGPVLFKMYPYQKRIIEAIHKNTRIITKLYRQAGKSVSLAAYITWFVMFNEYKTVAILANKMDIAKEIFSRVQFAVENLPLWLQQGIIEWNKTSFTLENGSECFAAATSPSAVRGRSISLLALDEFAHLKPNLAEEFIKSVFPTISSSQKSKMIIISTPNGLNHFYKIWNDSEQGRNQFVRIEGNWKENPNRTQEWADQQLKELGQVGFQQEVECIGGESKITILDTSDFSIFQVSIEDFFVKYLHGTGVIGFVSNTRYEILSPTGFQPFDGINRVRKSVLKIITSTKEIRVSPNHQFFYNGSLLLASSLVSGDYITPDEQILSIIESESEDYLYDPVNVGSDHLYIANGLVHHNCSFIGSSYTLIDGHKLAVLPYINPIFENNHLEVFKKPEKSHAYIISVDTSRGRGLDYSAFSVIDVTQLPYEVVACYKDNEISTMEYPHLIYNMARQYNEAYILVEVNDIGGEIANILWYDYEYENLYFTNNKSSITTTKGYPGVRTTTKVKTLGCSVLKDLIEKDQLILNSYRYIEELGVFTLQRKSYGADDPIINDDLTATLWLFAWLTKQEQFKEATDINIREVLAHQKSEYIDSQMTPFGFVVTGLEDLEQNNDSSKLPTPGSFGLTDSQLSLLT